MCDGNDINLCTAKTGRERIVFELYAIISQFRKKIRIYRRTLIFGSMGLSTDFSLSTLNALCLEGTEASCKVQRMNEATESEN